MFPVYTDEGLGWEMNESEWKKMVMLKRCNGSNKKLWEIFGH